MKYAKVQEEELKNQVARDFFGRFDHTKIIGEIDFAVKNRGANQPDCYFLWAEAKATQTDVCEMLAQLVLTIGKARTFDKIIPPSFLGCFDREKIAFVPYHAVQEIFYQSDFNWKVTPSKRDTPQFKHVYELIKGIIDTDKSGVTYRFDFKKDEKALKQFILENFIAGKSDITKTRIDKNNFINIYNRWLDAVKPTIAVNWEHAKKSNILDGDFYLADLLSRENKTLKEKLFVLLKSDYYEVVKGFDVAGFLDKKKADFNDNQKAHAQFWAIYERPPLEEYWDYIIERRDLLVPQDVRERKGSFFTPRIWVELSQQYIADVLGENWQEEYYVWDCAAGTGNLLTGLTNKYNVWASTLDKADVDVMHDRILNGANLLESHVFQFDFLNDDFSKLPQGLRTIINDPEKRKKLIVYINPPYVEAMNKREATKGKIDVNKTKVYSQNLDKLGKAGREIFVQFLTRIYTEIQGCKIGEFSKQKAIIAPNFKNFRKFFLANLKKSFIVPANTFDNVKGKFPIGFKIWDTGKGKHFQSAVADVYDATGKLIGQKTFTDGLGCKYINDWLKKYTDTNKNYEIGAMCCIGNDFQHNNYVNINFKSQLKGVGNAKGIAKFDITKNNLIVSSIYYAVRHVIEATWTNDRDQFLYPNNEWEKDTEFQSDCLTYTLFNNYIQSKYGTNHWVPYTENEVNAQDKFDSHFMTDFIAGKIQDDQIKRLLPPIKHKKRILVFSAEAKAVFKAGKKLWTYYHKQPKYGVNGYNVNASLYDIREHFQERNAQGKMNNKSTDETYNGLIAELRSALKALAMKIEPKVYEYGFLTK